MVDPAEFTPREEEVLRYIVDGYTARETGLELSLGARTIESHKLKIREKIAILLDIEQTELATYQIVQWYRRREALRQPPEELPVPVIVLHGYDNVDRDSIMMAGVMPSGL